jgi:pimeloyl-ACP methyl ester carboxylesterase
VAVLAVNDDLSAAPLEYIGDGAEALALRRIGQGPSLIMVPGFPLHGLTYRRVAALLSDRFTCCAVDVPGTGASRWSAASDFSFVAQATRISRLIDTLGTDRVAVLGHDTGASIARHVALAEPSRVDRLILLNTEIPGHRPPWIRTYQRLLGLPGSAGLFRTLLRSPTYLRTGMGFGGCFHDRSFIDGEFRRLFVEPIVADPRRAAGYAKYLRGFDWEENDAFESRHAQIRARTLFIWGRDDPTFPEPLARLMARQFQSCAGFESIPDARLLVHEERPIEVAGAVRAFLSAVG